MSARDYYCTDQLPWCEIEGYHTHMTVPRLPELVSAKAGKFHPSQGDMPKVPGKSCRHCGCLVYRRMFALRHMWNKSLFCDWKHGNLHMAELYEGP